MTRRDRNIAYRSRPLSYHARRFDTVPCILVVACFFVAAGGCVDLRVPDPDVRYVAFGDSATAGPSTRDYPDILGDLLGEPAGSIANEGLGGEAAAEGLDRLRALIADEIYPNATVLLYWEGGNDITSFIKEYDPLFLYSPDDPDYPFTAELEERLDQVRSDAWMALLAGEDAGLTVYAATYFPMREDLQECDALLLNIILPAQAAIANAYVDMLNARIRSAVSAAAGATLVDVAGLGVSLTASADNYYNCNHLSEQGNQVVAELFAQRIRTNAAP